MASSRTFELRTYRSAPGKLDALSSRFRDHTLAIFETHGIDVVGFWIAPDEDDTSTGTLVYICAFADRSSAETSWKAFRDDPKWIEARAASEHDGPLTTSVESLFLAPTDYSAIR